MMKLIEYFGWVGVSSIALMVFVWVGIGVAYLRGRILLAVAAVGMAVLALGFARWNSTRISAIEPDPKEAAQAVAAAIESGRALANGGQSIYEQAAQEEPLYRRRGKQRRVGTELAQSSESPQPNSLAALAPSPEEAPPAPEARYLPKAELKQANRWDVLNLGFARFTLWATLPLLAFLYLRRFNASEGNPFPLPISGGWTETLSPSLPLLTVPIETPKDLARHLEILARRGESFLCFAPRPDSTGKLFRFRLGQRGFRELPVDDNPPLRQKADAEFLFEAFWFNRMAFFLPNRERDTFVLDSLLCLLDHRARLAATIRTPLNIIIPAEIANRFPAWNALADFATHTGIRIHLIGPGKKRG